MHAMVLLACMITIMIVAFVSSYDRTYACSTTAYSSRLSIDIHYNIPIASKL